MQPPFGVIKQPAVTQISPDTLNVNRRARRSTREIGDVEKYPLTMEKKLFLLIDLHVTKFSAKINIFVSSYTKRIKCVTH